MEKLDDAHFIDGFHFDYRIFLNLSSPKKRYLFDLFYRMFIKSKCS